MPISGCRAWRRLVGSAAHASSDAIAAGAVSVDVRACPAVPTKPVRSRVVGFVVSTRSGEPRSDNGRLTKPESDNRRLTKSQADVTAVLTKARQRKPQRKGTIVAQQVNVVLVDDIDGSEAGETVLFGLDGATYEIDLSDKNAKKLRDSVALYVASARRTGGRRSATRASGRPATNAAATDTAAVRAWAKSKGYEVSDRGRISAEILDSYRKANRK